MKDATEEDGDDSRHLGDLRREVAGVGEEEEEAGFEELEVPHTGELCQQGGQHSCKSAESSQIKGDSSYAVKYEFNNLGCNNS